MVINESHKKPNLYIFHPNFKDCRWNSFMKFLYMNNILGESKKILLAYFSTKVHRFRFHMLDIIPYQKILDLLVKFPTWQRSLKIEFHEYFLKIDFPPIFENLIMVHFKKKYYGYSLFQNDFLVIDLYWIHRS